MAEDSIASLALVEKHAHAGLFKELGQYALRRLMGMEAVKRMHAARHERKGDRLTHRYQSIMVVVPVSNRYTYDL